MRHVQLESWQDHNGTLGLILAGSPKDEELFADFTGGLIAHDLIEHQNGASRIGQPDDEIEAIGAMWQVRGRHGDFVQDDPRVGSAWTPEQSTILELASIARNVGWHTDWTPRIGQYVTRPHYQDETFIEMLDWVRPHVEAEVEDLDELFPLEAYLENALHLLRTGYRKAERRFGPDYDGIDLFRAIKRAVSPHASRVEAEGQIFRLSYGRGEARCDEVLDQWMM